MSARDERGRFRPGSPGGPGRPKGFRGVAAEIMRRTRDGVELVAFAESIWRDETASPAVRWEAFQWLADRGLGRAVNQVELLASLQHTATASALPESWFSMSLDARRDWLAANAPEALPPGRE